MKQALIEWLLLWLFDRGIVSAYRLHYGSLRGGGRPFEWSATIRPIREIPRRWWDRYEDEE